MSDCTLLSHVCDCRLLSQLTRLTLAHNKLMGKWAYFPISALSNLTELRLTGNQLPEPPTGVARSLPLPLSISLYVCLLRLK